jgi:hypothetical protein
LRRQQFKNDYINAKEQVENCSVIVCNKKRINMNDSILISNSIDNEEEKKKALDFYERFHNISSRKRYREPKVKKTVYQLRHTKSRRLSKSINLGIEDDDHSEYSNDSEFDINEYENACNESDEAIHNKKLTSYDRKINRDIKFHTRCSNVITSTSSQTIKVKTEYKWINELKLGQNKECKLVY